MSPTPKSKAKSSPKMAKEHQKASSSPPSTGGNAQATTSSPSSAASPSLETAQLATSHTGRLLVMAETEEQINCSIGSKTEYDSVSNNGSCSGESEDQKEKVPASTAPQPETIPGGDNDKRDKIRQKNERKHQRQKERRAQELQERCTSILMSRKLDMLTQQFVAMGFPAERATRALILNEGRVEDSVSWLFEGGTGAEQNEEAKKDGAANMKIDISDELAKMMEMEAKFKCSKQEVQRAVVSCEGDLEKAMEILNVQQKQNTPSTPPSTMESGGTVPALNGTNRVMQPSQAVVTAKPTASVAIQKLRREERDLNYPKATVAGRPSSPDLRNVVLQPSLKAQPKSDWAKNQVTAQIDRRWPNATSGPFSYTMASSSLQAVAPPPKAETRHGVLGGEVSRLGLQPGTIREPVIVMQRPQSMNVKHQQPSASAGLSMPPPVTTGWESNRLSLTDTVKITNGGLAQRYPNMNQSTGSLLNPNSQPFLHPDRNRHSFVSSPLEVDAAGRSGSSWSSGRPSGQPSSLAASSSLGIFTGWGSSSGSSGSSSPVDWSNGGLIPQLDYTRVDWSLDSTPLAFDDLQAPASAQFYEAWLNQFDSSNFRNSRMFPHSNRVARFQDSSSLLSVDPITTVLSPDWTSPFAGKDIFRVPRQIVTSPTP